MPARATLALKIKDFEGPLDLLFHLIEKNDIDIYDIPIADITDQYMAYLHEMHHLDMEFASDFLVMAATLVYIKTRMLLPGRIIGDENMSDDPREELVIRLLQYRRCKLLSGELQERHRTYATCVFRLPTPPAFFDICPDIPIPDMDAAAFNQAVDAVCARNKLRFADLSARVTHILKREKVSVREKMQQIRDKLAKKAKAFFHEIFPKGVASPAETIAGFLAVLELLRRDEILAIQKKPFDVILLEKQKSNLTGDANDEAQVMYD